jgi:hypothetical protein
MAMRFVLFWMFLLNDFCVILLPECLNSAQIYGESRQNVSVCRKTDTFLS